MNRGNFRPDPAKSIAGLTTDMTMTFDLAATGIEHLKTPAADDIQRPAALTQK
jgi:hypothetical protein